MKAIRSGYSFFIPLWVIWGLFLFSSCGDDKAEALARAHDQYLYRSDLVGVVPEGVSGNDSIQLAHAYIEQWMNQQALLHQAQRNVNINTDRLEQQVAEYRNGLIVYEYEQALISQKLDTVVVEEDIRAFYEQQQDMFMLQQPILKASYIHLKKDAPELARVRRLFASKNANDTDLLQQYCEVYAINHELYDREWHFADDLNNIIPLSRISEDRYKDADRFFEIIVDNELYLIILHEARLRNTRAPLSMEKENIRNLILNKRKMDLLTQMQKSIIEDARRKNNIELLAP